MIGRIQEDLGGRVRQGAGIPPWAILAIPLLALAASVLAMSTKQALAILALALMVPFAVYSMRHPYPALILYLLAKTNFLEFVQPGTWSRVTLAPAVSITITDMLMVVMVIVAAKRLPRREEKPVFMTFVVIWFAYVAVRFMFGMAVGESSLDDATMNIRYQIGWLDYLIIIAVMEKPRDIRNIVTILLCIAVASTSVQVIEAGLGHRIKGPAALQGAMDQSFYGDTQYIEVGGREVPYLWSRAAQATLVTALIGLVCVLEGIRPRFYGIGALFGFLGLAIASVRAWYFGTMVGVMVVVAMQRRRIESAARFAVALWVLAGVVVLLAPFLQNSYGSSPWAVWLGRAQQITNYSGQQTFNDRVDRAARTWETARQSLWIGYGWGKTSLANMSETSLNTILIHGILGTALILGMYLYVLHSAWRLWSILPQCEERAYLAGLCAVMIAFLAMAFSQDSLNAGGFAVIAAAFVDRIWVFRQRGLWIDEARAPASS